MTVAPAYFSRELVNDFDRFKALFNGENELKQIEKFSKEPLKPEGSYYYNRWQVAVILIKAPFKIILGVFLTYISFIAYFFSQSIYRYSKVWIAHLEIDLHHLYYMFFDYGPRLLIPSLNYAQTSIGDVFTQKPLKKKDILSPEIRKALAYDAVTFDILGLCGGGTKWFNHLFLKATENVELTEEVVKRTAIAVAKLFENGIPRQSALLQAFWLVEEPVLNETREDYDDFSTTNGKTGVLNWFNRIPNGIHYLALFRTNDSSHAVAYIKHNHLQLIWDPNYGLIEIKNSDQLYAIINKYAEKEVVRFTKKLSQNVPLENII